jgi:hypothetical protein
MVVRKVKFPDLQEAAMLSQAPHTGLKLLFREGVEDQVDAWGRRKALTLQHTDHKPAPKPRALPG